MATCKDCIHYEVCENHAKMLEEDGYEIEFDDTLEVEKRCAAFKPTADVVPKSEVERLERICHSYALQYGTVTDQQKVIDKAKSDVAKEIFEEIEENVLGGHFLKSYEWNEEAYSELKKKYTEVNV